MSQSFISITELHEETAIGRLGELHARLAGVLLPEATVRLSPGLLSCTDPRAAQLIEAARLHAINMKADFSLIEPAGADLLSMLSRLGIKVAAPAEMSFWMKGSTTQ